MGYFFETQWDEVFEEELETQYMNEEDASEKVFLKQLMKEWNFSRGLRKRLEAVVLPKKRSTYVKHILASDYSIEL